MCEVQATVTASELHFALETNKDGCSSLKIVKTYTKKNGEGATEFSFTIGPAGTQRIREVVNSPRSNEYVEITDTVGANFLIITKINPTNPRLCMSFLDEEDGQYQILITGDDFDRLESLLNAKTDLSSE